MPIVKFIREAYRELTKVVWPTLPNALRLTFAVIVISLIFGLFIAGVDYVFTRGFRAVLVWYETVKPTETVGTIPQITPEDIQVETEPVE